MLVGSVAVLGLTQIASAESLISYTTSTVGPTDLENVNITVPAWDPGDSNTTLSNQSTTMMGLSTPGVGYVLDSYDIFVTSTLTGSYTIIAGSTGAGGTVQIDTYNAVAETPIPVCPAAGCLTNTFDPPNDIFYNGKAKGYGNDPQDPGAGPSSISLGANGSSTFSTPSSGDVDTVDYGCVLANGAHCHGTGSPVTTGLGSVTGPPDLLNFYLSTVTETVTALSSGNTSTSYNTSIAEQVTVSYDYHTVALSSTPEPTTMVLFGSALVGLGLLRKRIRS
jgi:hypothetical protein